MCSILVPRPRFHVRIHFVNIATSLSFRLLTNFLLFRRIPLLSRCAERSFNNSSYLSCNPPSRIGQYFITLNRSSRKIALAKSIGISFPSTSVKTFLNDAIASFSAFVWMGLPVRLDFRIPSSRSCEVDNGDVEVGGFGRVLVGVERGYLLIASLRLLENVTKTLYFLFARLLIAY